MDSKDEEAARLFAAGIQAGKPETDWHPDAPLPKMDDYELVEQIGMGGMGAVYLGHALEDGHPVAVKMLHTGPDGLDHERLIREGKALACLDHPHIVAIEAYGTAQNGEPFLVLEYMGGGDLNARLQSGPLAPDEALIRFREVVEAVSYAHDAGIIHRDIKPPNVMFSEDGTIRVGDFGLAKMQRADYTTTLTLSGTTVGTLDYMSPEQRTGNVELDERGDIYSLGVMLYEMLSGERPRGVFPPLASLGHSAKLDTIVHRCMQSNPEERYANCGELLAALDALKRPSPKRWLWLLIPLSVVVIAAGTASLLQPEARTMPEIPALEGDEKYVFDQHVDLLAANRWKLGRLEQAGSWRFKDGALQVEAKDSAAWLDFELDPGEVYDLYLEVEHIAGEETTAIFFNSTKGPGSFEIDAGGQGYAGFQLLNEKDLASQPNRHPNNERYSRDTRNVLLFRVRPDKVKVYLNGQLRWAVPMWGNELSRHSTWGISPASTLGLGSYDNSLIFHRIDLKKYRDKL